MSTQSFQVTRSSRLPTRSSIPKQSIESFESNSLRNFRCAQLLFGPSKASSSFACGPIFVMELGSPETMVLWPSGYLCRSFVEGKLVQYLGFGRPLTNAFAIDVPNAHSGCNIVSRRSMVTSDSLLKLIRRSLLV